MGANEKHAATYHGLSDDTVRGRYCDGTHAQTGRTTDGAEYDTWIAGVKAEAKAEALEEAAESLNPELINYRRDAMEVLSQRIQPAGGNDTLSLQLALVAAKRSREWLHNRANQYKEEPDNGR